ncbi:MAG: PH domain-containing protein [Phycisphaerae bacterium]|nr:PH domain-containing protein [Phycisphaerae bacterium]NUQ45425.1 PH domain-containing protein [Phycisphaerae bacterium]
MTSNAPQERAWVAPHADTPSGPVPAVTLTAEGVVPAHLLSGGERVLLAIKPSLWFVLFASGRVLAAMALAALVATQLAPSEYHALTIQAAVSVGLLRLAWATLQWVSRLYVLTDFRIMRIRGIVNVEVFECPLTRIQNTELALSLPERVTRTGTIHMATAGFGTGHVAWRTVARPLEVHEMLRAAINRATLGRGEHGV